MDIDVNANEYGVYYIIRNMVRWGFRFASHSPDTMP
jgi:hypothetical protein